MTVAVTAFGVTIAKMGILKWFRGKKKPEDVPAPGEPRVVGRSPGGSDLIQYGGHEFDRPQIGFVEEDLSELAALRERTYEEMFGEPDIVSHEVLPLIPHVDVYRFPPTAQRPFTTYATAGMSDLPQHAPPEAGADVRRVELVFYAAESNDAYPELLRNLAHFVHDNRTWLFWGHSMANGTPPEPVFGMGPLDAFLFMPSIVKPDSGLGERLSWNGEAVQLVWVVPITSAELAYKLEHGIDAMYELFDEVDHPFVFAGSRSSYV